MTARIIVFEAPLDKRCKSVEQLNLPIEFIFPAGSRRPSVWDTGAAIPAIERRLEEINFDETKDILLVTPQSVEMAVAISVVSAYGTFRALLWDAKRQGYIERVIGVPLMDDERPEKHLLNR